MSNTMKTQNTLQTGQAGLVPYLKALTFAAGLMVVWVGLCAI
jgi:hypothetical protein